MNDINELRTHLFDTLRGLRSKDDPMDIDRAKSVSEVAKTLIESAKVEVDYLRVTGESKGTGFIAIEDKQGDASFNEHSRQVNEKRKTLTTVEIINGARVVRHVAK